MKSTYLPIDKILFIILLLCLTGCSSNRLSVQTQYLTRENLASYYIGTPDPHLDNPIQGQRLFIQWCLPTSELQGKDVVLSLQIRLRNYQEKTITSPITPKSGKFNRGYFLFDLIDKEYGETGGIITYQVEILVDGSLIELWKHPLWVNLITFEEK